ncbi:MAG TPA: hypothetical protein VK949_07705 [Methylotenera sp.]|nr:hypothetical protein [Methylotenera sp.]
MAIKRFIKENLVLVIGLSLPLLLIVLFFVATVIPKSMATPPQYEMLFTVTKYDYQNAPDYLLSYAVKDKHLVVKAKKNEEKPRNSNINTLLAYDAKTETVREINIDTSKLTETNSEMVVEETKNYVIDNSTVSPDGYKLEGPNYSGGGLMGSLFGGGYRNTGFRITKGNVGYKLPETQQDFYYNQVKFIGWIIKK